MPPACLRMYARNTAWPFSPVAPGCISRRSRPGWRRDGLPPLLPQGQFRALFLSPDRDELYAQIDGRFDAMLNAGALEEVAALAARRLDPLLPAMKAHGVPALIRHLKGEITREAAAVTGRADTRHYAKRHFTWVRHEP